MKTVFKLSDIARDFGGKLIGSDQEIRGIASLQSAAPGDLTFLSDARYLPMLSNTQASAVIIKPKWADDTQRSALVSDDPRTLFSKIANTLFVPETSNKSGIHPTAQIGSDCSLAGDVRIDAGVVLGAGCVLGSGVWIQAAAVLGDGVVVGKNSRIESQAVIRDHVVLGEDNWIHSGAILGGEGFGFYQEDGVFHRVVHHGSVRCGNRVEVGCNTTVDRGYLDDTMLEDDVKLDNQVQVGHNVFIGRGTAVAGCVALAGSSVIGAHCQIGGGSVVAGHVTLSDHVVIMGGSEVGSSIKVAGVYGSGSLLQPAEKWKRNYIRQGQLDQMMQRLKALEDHA